MDNHLLPYPAYKPSGIPWLGDVPEHWDVRRGKALLTPVDIRSKTGEEELLTVSAQKGVIPRKSTDVTMFKAESYVGYKLCWPGDLVINSLWAWAHGLGVSRHHGIVSTAYGVYRPLPKAHPHFVHQLVRSVPFQWELKVRSKGIWVSRLQLTDEEFLEAPFPVPPLPEQTAIVRYLHHIDDRIRRYVIGKQKLIQLLEKEKRAVINRAVTQGLDPTVRLKPSGLEWLGDIPGHWAVRRIRNAVEMRVSNVDKHINDNELPIRLCNYVDVYRNDRITESVTFMRATATADEIDRFRLEQGDVLITKDSEVWNDIGVPALVEYTAADLVCGYHLALLRPLRGLLNGAYLCRALQTPAVTYQFHTGANGVTRYGLSHHAIKSALLPLPPVIEQIAIVRYLDKSIADIDTAISRARHQIEFVQEYRTRLIADVVTGKLDVRGAAAKLPDEGGDTGGAGHRENIEWFHLKSEHSSVPTTLYDNKQPTD